MVGWMNEWLGMEWSRVYVKYYDARIMGNYENKQIVRRPFSYARLNNI